MYKKGQPATQNQNSKRSQSQVIERRARKKRQQELAKNNIKSCSACCIGEIKSGDKEKRSVCYTRILYQTMGLVYMLKSDLIMACICSGGFCISEETVGLSY